MSLKIKIPFFTGLFVILATIALLAISIRQADEKKNKDISSLRTLITEHPAMASVLSSRIDNHVQETAAVIRDRIFFASAMVIICLLVILFFSQRITSPINKLVWLAEEISSGRRGYSERISIISNDETGKLSHSFNRLLKSTELLLEQSKASEKKYRELVENANSAIIRLDKSGDILFFNECAQNLFGYMAAEVVGEHIDAIIRTNSGAADPSPGVFELLKNNRYIELEHRTRNGNYLWVGWTNHSLKSADEHPPNELLCVGSDITDKKKMEHLAKIEQSKLIQTDKISTLGVMAAGIAHEINNPNNFIILNSQNFREMWNGIQPVLDKYAATDPDFSISEMPYEEARKCFPVLIQGITDGARRIQRIVDAMKEFSSHGTGNRDETVDVHKVIESAQLIIGNLLKKATHHFTVEFQKEIPMIRGNFQRLEQVIINILSNACQANDDPEKPIVLRAKYKPESRQVVVSVTDHGVGILPEHIKKLFDPFFTTKREEGGTGLGLAIAYSIVKDHGGELSIESEYGNGTTVTIELPVSPAAN